LGVEVLPKSEAKPVFFDLVVRDLSEAVLRNEGGASFAGDFDLAGDSSAEPSTGTDNTDAITTTEGGCA
jgi:hypothetical protein